MQVYADILTRRQWNGLIVIEGILFGRIKIPHADRLRPSSPPFFLSD